MKRSNGIIRLLTAILFLFCFVPAAFGVTIDVMIVYDTTAKSWVNNGQGGMDAFAADAVARMNQAATNSNVNLTFRLVHTADISYTYNRNLGLDTALNSLQSGTGNFSVVHQWRDTYGADLVALLVDTGSAFGTVGTGYLLTTLSGEPAFAFSTTAIQSVDIGHTLTHEVGHNLGCHHSKNQTSDPGPNTDLNTYSAGWYFTGTNATKYHTIMAYNDDGHGNRYFEAPLFSTPLLNYQGTPAGDAQDGDNARNIRGTMDIVAAYRTAVICTFTLSPANQGFSPLSGTGSVTVTASSSSCSWTGTSNDPWIAISSGGSGTGGGTVNYSVAANSGAARTGTMTIGGQTVTLTQAGTVITNSVGPRNTIKVTDVSGSLPAGGAAVTVRAWDVNGNVIPESPSAAPLKLFNNATTTIAGAALAARFPTGTPMTYEFTVDSAKVVITNVKSSTDGTLNIPIGYTTGVTNFIANSIGPRNTIKITDMSGSLPVNGAAITVKAWDANGNAIPESGGAAALKLSSHATTTIGGPALAARFPTGAPLTYEFTVDSAKVVITNVKSSADGSINIPSVYTSGTSNFAANSIGPLNSVRMTDVSGSLPSGAAVTIKAWGAAGTAIPESGSAFPLTIFNHETIPLSGTALAARFPSGTPMAYEFTVGSPKFVITNVKSSVDGTVTIPTVYSSGTTDFVANYVSSRNTIKITDMSGSLPAGGAAITVTAWDAAGTSVPETGSAAALKLTNFGTTTIAGADLAARFPGTPVSYIFSIGSTKVIVTNVTSSTDGSINIPSVYTSGVGGGI